MATRRCYLICSDAPLINRKGASEYLVNHYIGHTSRSLDARLREHQTNQGARICAAFVQAGGTLLITRSWPGGWREEKMLKGYGKAARLCPRCCGDIAMYRHPRGMKRGRNLWKALQKALQAIPQALVTVEQEKPF